MLAFVNNCTRLCGVVLFGALVLVGASQAQAQVLVYSDVTNFTGYGYNQGGAANIGTDGTTKMVADLLSLQGGYAGGKVDLFEWSTANFNAGAVSARALVRFYADNGSGGGPGTYLAGYNFNPISFPGGNEISLWYYSASGLFTIPSDDNVWAAISYDNNGGTTGATLAQLNDLGQGIFAPPTVGTSPGVFFQTNSAGGFVQNNPAGGFLYFGGNPVADFGWVLDSAALPSVPEPGSIALLSAFALMGVGAFGKMRLKKRIQDQSQIIAS
jgi:hypothetical protein